MLSYFSFKAYNKKGGYDEKKIPVDDYSIDFDSRKFIFYDSSLYN